MDDTAIIDVLRHIKGKGPMHWKYVLEEWQSMTQGTPKEFNEQLLAMQAKYPNRLIITRPYNQSASPTLEVPAL